MAMNEWLHNGWCNSTVDGALSVAVNLGHTLWILLGAEERLEQKEALPWSDIWIFACLPTRVLGLDFYPSYAPLLLFY